MHLDPYTPEASPITEDHLVDATDVAAVVDGTKRGWFIDLKHDGEKMLSSPVILDGRVLATTYVPESASTHACEPRLGTGRLYVVDAFTGEGLLDDIDIQQQLDNENRSRELKSGGIPPPISLLVSEQDVNTPVALVGLESVEGVKMSRQRKNTYWAEY